MAQPSMTSMTVCIVGLGYVGYPLAEAFSRHVRTLGFDIDKRKIESLKNSSSKIIATSDPELLHEADFILICVPTLLTEKNEPDLSYVKDAAKTIGRHLKKGSVVILESTVYPGVTEDVLLPVIETESGLVAGRDFKVGYSPERINPGDNEHDLSRMTKIVAGMDPETTGLMAELYSLITNVYRAPGIRIAEAAKVVENIQRDINIGLINELSQMFHTLGINTRDVLDAASTKWNFHQYTPGIVGGHCIPTVPYFLAYAAKQHGYKPQIILASRSTNDNMIPFISRLVTSNIRSAGKSIPGAKIAVLGLTYKENVPDYRDNPVFDLIRVLRDQQIEVFGYDPLLNDEIIAGLGVKPLADIHHQMDGYILAAPHNQFRDMVKKEFTEVSGPGVIFIDIKGAFYKDPWMHQNFNYITL